jgi:4-amino-4-deoxy-L-arabinose transferase-like glycosyltransferase
VYWLPLVLITLLAAGLRFSFLSRPSIWGDEAATYGRVNGSFYQLLEVLQFDGFAPLHYEFYFFLARHFTLTPPLMRLWPALAGTLTVPAIYFLSRQLVSRQVSLIAALLTACSAYQLYYARDAKMYAPLWLFVSLSMGCFLAWLNSSRGLARPSRFFFLAWIFCTIAAAGIHTPGLVVLALQPIVFLAHRNRYILRAVAGVVGVAVILAGPLYHYLTFNKWFQRIEETGWNASMIQWVNEYNAERFLPQLVRSASSAYATAWEWPDKPYLRAALDPDLLRWAQVAVIGIGLLLTAGLLPWRRAIAWVNIVLRRPRANTTAFADTRIPPSSESALPAFALFTLLVWIILPPWCIYLASYDTPAAPWELPLFIHSNAPCSYVVLTCAALGLGFSLRSWRDVCNALIVFAALAVLIIGAFLAVGFHRTHTLAFLSHWPFLTATAKTPDGANVLWMPRYLGAVTPPLLILAAWFFWRLPLGVRHVAITIFCCLNLANFAAKIYLDPEPPVGQMIADIYADSAASPESATTLTFVRPPYGGQAAPGTAGLNSGPAKYYLSIRLNPPLDPPTFRDYRGGIFSFVTIRRDVNRRTLSRLLSERANTNTIILWTRDETRRFAQPNLPDPLGNYLPKDKWKLEETTTHQAYDHWTWEPLSLSRRYVYRKVTGPAAPTSLPTRPS